MLPASSEMVQSLTRGFLTISGMLPSLINVLPTSSATSGEDVYKPYDLFSNPGTLFVM